MPEVWGIGTGAAATTALRQGASGWGSSAEDIALFCPTRRTA